MRHEAKKLSKALPRNSLKERLQLDIQCINEYRAKESLNSSVSEKSSDLSFAKGSKHKHSNSTYSALSERSGQRTPSGVKSQKVTFKHTKPASSRDSRKKKTITADSNEHEAGTDDYGLNQKQFLMLKVGPLLHKDLMERKLQRDEFLSDEGSPQRSERVEGKRMFRDRAHTEHSLPQ